MSRECTGGHDSPEHAPERQCRCIQYDGWRPGLPDGRQHNNDNFKNCSATYCHSTGQSTTNGSQLRSDVRHGDLEPASSGACGTCHGKASTPMISSGTHTVHINGGSTCENCHTGAGTGASYTTSNHLNHLIDVADGYDKGSDPGNGYGKCSTASCHGTSSPSWGVVTAGDTCTKCHGTSSGSVNGDNQYFAAPPKDLAGESGSLLRSRPGQQ